MSSYNLLQESNLLTNGYALLPLKVAKDKQLSSTEILVFAIISSHCAKIGYAFGSNQYFAELIGVRSETISRAINKLDKLHYLTSIIDKKRGNTRAVGIGDWDREALKDLLIKNQYPIDKKSIAIDKISIAPRLKLKLKKQPNNNNIIKKDNNTLLRKEEFGNSSINKGMELLTNFFGYKPSRTPLNRYALHRLLKSRGEKRTFKAMEFALSQQKNRYCPVITSYMDLEKKWADLEVYARREFSGPKKGGVIDGTNL